MIDTDIVEGKCIEVLINGKSDNELSSKVRITYDKRDIADTHCASKDIILTIGWNSRLANNNNDCFFEDGKAAIENTRFGVITTHTPVAGTSITFDPTVLSVILIMAIIIFVLLFLGLGYTLYVYVTPKDPVDVSSMWDNFDKERMENIQKKREERAKRKEELARIEREIMGDDDNYDDFSDGMESVDPIYEDIMRPIEDDESDNEVDEVNETINYANESSKLAQEMAGNIDIGVDNDIEPQEEMGELRKD